MFHIGSTAVRGVEEKSIVDTMPGVKDTQKVNGYNKEKGENELPGRVFSKRKLSPNVTLLIKFNMVQVRA
nr:GrpB family protein [Domibacillus robiginosus]